MMSNLFSIFDPNSGFSSLANWMSMMMILGIPSTYWLGISKINYLLMTLMNIMNNEIKLSLQTKSMNSIMMIAFLMMLVYSNLLSLFPYIFNTTSHLSVTLTMSMPMWLALMLFGWYNYMNHMLAHLVPSGTPSNLMFVMVIIESISNLIRPMTLAIRLTANMIAGHLLICLLGNQFNPTFSMVIMPLLLIQTMLMILEISVSLIQSYVFAMLLTLYTSEIN